MKRRQTSSWLIIDKRPTDDQWRTIRRVRRGCGILLLAKLSTSERRRLRHLSKTRGLTVVEESCGGAARVHDMKELRRALLQRKPLILLSPIHDTGSHPGWSPMPRMRAATFARLAGRKPIALGGMNRKRYAKIAPLGFTGWAGISAFKT